jgi:peroxiredoxin
MVVLHTPICEFGKPAVDFSLLGTDGKNWSLDDCRGEKGLLIMFICNHCPYVKPIRPRLVEDTRVLISEGIGVVAIMPNDPFDYPEDSFENMKRIAQESQFPFPYLWDETQEIARSFGAICTPDFFGYNADLKLQYRGRLDASGRDPAPTASPRDLLNAMRQIASTGHGPADQVPSMGCSIKWRESEI